MKQVFLVAIIAAMPAAAEGSATVEVRGDVKQALSLSMEDFAKMPRAAADTKAEGIGVHYEGVWLHDGKPLTGTQGPFRLVAAKDKKGTRSVRMLCRLHVVLLRK